MSLDGVVDGTQKFQSPYFNDEMMQDINAGVSQADAVLLGTRTYQQFSEIWPPQGDETPMAHFLNTAPKYVVSNTLTTLGWHNSMLLSGELTQELMKLKQQPGKNILIPGSPRLVRSLLQRGMLDQLSLSILPIVLGSGLRLFDEMPEQLGLKLVDSKTYSNGVMNVTYQPVKK